MIREDVKESLDAYAKEGRPTGGFLEAVLSNDLMGALGRADLQNRYDIFDICSYVYNHCPANCHGSPARVTPRQCSGCLPTTRVRGASTNNTAGMLTEPRRPTRRAPKAISRCATHASSIEPSSSRPLSGLLPLGLRTRRFGWGVAVESAGK